MAQFSFCNVTNQGNAAAMINLGLMYLSGNGMPKDLSETVRLYRGPIELGNVEAIYWLCSTSPVSA